MNFIFHAVIMSISRDKDLFCDVHCNTGIDVSTGRNSCADERGISSFYMNEAVFALHWWQK